MTKVRINQAIASSEDWAYAPDEIVDMPDEQAKVWIGSGLASPLEEADKGKEALTHPTPKEDETDKKTEDRDKKAPETATRKQPETATMPSGKRVRR